MTNENLIRLMTKLTEEFLSEFKFNYSIMNIKGKSVLFKYVFSYLKRWYYTSLIPDIGLSPAYIVNNSDYMPVIKSRSVSRLSGFKISIEENTIDNPIIIRDIRTIYNNCANGIRAENGNIFDNAFYMSVRDKLVIDDYNYINYVVYIMVRLGLIEAMPSIGVAMFCQGKPKLLELENRELFKIIADEAILMAAENLECFCSLEKPLNSDAIKELLKEKNSIDIIFEDYFVYPEGELDYIPDLDLDDEFDDDFDESIFGGKQDFMFEAGIAFDKWFLTPFGAYLGLITPCYTAEYILYNEMDLFLEVTEGVKHFNAESDPGITLYSPCTEYFVANNACKLWNIENREYDSNIFEHYTSEELADIVTENRLSEYCDDLVYNFYPPYKVCRIKISFKNDKGMWFDADIKEDCTLSELSRLINGIVFHGFASVDKYKFYTEPASPFTQYEYPVNTRRSSNVFNKPLFEIFNGSNTLFYSLSAELFGKYAEIDFKIDLLKIFDNTVETRTPNIVKRSIKFRNTFS